MHSNVTMKNASWPHFSWWATLYKIIIASTTAAAAAASAATVTTTTTTIIIIIIIILNPRYLWNKKIRNRKCEEWHLIRAVVIDNRIVE